MFSARSQRWNIKAWEENCWSRGLHHCYRRCREMIRESYSLPATPWGGPDSWMRRFIEQVKTNNLRIYQIPEGSEGNDMKAFVEDLIEAVVKPMLQVNLQIERVHQSPTNWKTPLLPRIPALSSLWTTRWRMQYSDKHGVRNKSFTNQNRSTLTMIILQNCKGREQVRLVIKQRSGKHQG